MNSPLTTPKIVFKLITLFALVGATAAVVPAPRFTAEAQGVKTAIAMNPDLTGWTIAQQTINWK